MTPPAGDAGRGSARDAAGRPRGPGRDSERGTPAIVPVPAQLEVVVDDLAFYEGEAIARPVTAELQATTALLRRVEVAAGPTLSAQLQVQESLGVGAAVVSGAGDLRVQLLVHAVVMSRDERVSRDGVRRATLAALQRAADFEIVHLALPPFGLGAGNLDVEDSAGAMLEAVRQHAGDGQRARWPRRLTFVVENEEERRAFVAALPVEEA